MINIDYYMNTFGGDKVPAGVFEKAKRQAESYLDRITFGRYYSSVEHEQKVKTCLCEMCDLIYDHANRDGKEKKSENIDGYSVTYVTEQADGQDSNAVLASKLYRVAEVYLGNTELLDLGA